MAARRNAKTAPKKATADVAPKKAAPKKAASKKATPKVTAPRKAAPKKVAPKATASKKAAPKVTASKKVAPKAVAPEKTTPRTAAAKAVATKTSAPRKAAVKASAPRKAAAKASPGAAAARKAAPKGAAAGGAPVAAFDLAALLEVRDTIGQTNWKSEPFSFRLDPAAAARWLAGGVPFQIPLGAPRAILGKLAPKAGSVGWTLLFGEDGPVSDLSHFSDPPRANDAMTHALHVDIQNDTIVGVTYQVHGWTYCYDSPSCRVPAGAYNSAFRGLLKQGLPAAGFPLRAEPDTRGNKERTSKQGGVHASWSRYNQTSYDLLRFSLYAWTGPMHRLL